MGITLTELERLEAEMKKRAASMPRGADRDLVQAVGTISENLATLVLVVEQLTREGRPAATQADQNEDPAPPVIQPEPNPDPDDPDPDEDEVEDDDPDNAE